MCVQKRSITPAALGQVSRLLRLGRTTSCLLLLQAVLGRPALAGSISVRVTDEKGANIQYASVIVLEAQVGAATGRTGRASIAYIPSGRYTVRVSAIGFVRYNATSVKVNDTGTTTLNIALRRHRVRSRGCTMREVDTRLRPATFAHGIIYFGGNRIPAPLSLGFDGMAISVNGRKLPSTEPLPGGGATPEARRHAHLYMQAMHREIGEALERGAVLIISRDGWTTVQPRKEASADGALRAFQRGKRLTDSERQLLSGIEPMFLVEVRQPVELEAASEER